MKLKEDLENEYSWFWSIKTNSKNDGRNARSKKKVLLDDRYYEILKQFKKAFNSTLAENLFFLIC